MVKKFQEPVPRVASDVAADEFVDVSCVRLEELPVVVKFGADEVLLAIRRQKRFRPAPRVEYLDQVLAGEHYVTKSRRVNTSVFVQLVGEHPLVLFKQVHVNHCAVRAHDPLGYDGSIDKLVFYGY